MRKGRARTCTSRCTVPIGSAFSPYVSLRLAQGLSAGSLSAFRLEPAARTRRRSRTAGTGPSHATGAVYTFGDTPYFGGLNRPAGTTPVVDLGPRPNGDGYWLVDAAGDAHPFGAAPNFGR